MKGESCKQDVSWLKNADTIKNNNNNDDRTAKIKINRFWSKPKPNPDPQKKLHNHSVIEAATNRRNNKPFKWWDSLKMRPPWSICLFCFFYLVELKL
jgi:hypothetical protein